jgi:hypothetical protein
MHVTMTKMEVGSLTASCENASNRRAPKGKEREEKTREEEEGTAAKSKSFKVIQASKKRGTTSHKYSSIAVAPSPPPPSAQV